MTEPVTVYDKDTYQVITTTPEDVAANPVRFQSVGNQKTIMVGPDGVATPVPASEAQARIDAGWQFGSEDHQRSERNADYQLRAHDDAFNVAGAHFVNQMLMGVPDVVAGHTGPNAIQDTVAREGQQRGFAQAEANHKTAGMIGGVLGVAGNVALTAGIGGAANAGRAAGTAAAEGAVEAAAPGLASRIFAKAAQGAAEGAAYAAPQAVAQAAYGDVGDAAESMLWGVGAGGLIGAGHGLFSAGVTGAQGVARNAALKAGIIDEAGTVSHDGIRAALGFGEKSAAHLEGKTVPELEALGKATSEKIAAHGEALDAAIRKAPAAERATYGVVPSELAEKLGNDIRATNPGLTTPLYKQEANQLSKIVDTFAEQGDKPIAFRDLNQLESFVREKAGDSSIGRQAADIITAEKNKAMNEAYNALGLTGGYGDYLAQKQQLEQIGTAIRNGGTINPIAQGITNKGIGALAGMAAGAGGALGHAIAGPVGGMVGYGAVKGIAGGVIQHAIGNQALELSTKALRTIADKSPEWIGTALAKSTADAATARLSDVAGVLTRATSAPLALDPVKAMLGPKANGLTKDQQYAQLTRSLSAATPESVAHESQTMGHLMSNDPALQQAVAAKQSQAVQYLQSAVPKNTAPPIPFDKSEWVASQADKQAFLDKLQVVQNPAVVLEHVTQGTLTPAHVEALNTVYPGMASKIVGQIATLAHDPKAPDVSAGVKHGLSLLTGQSMTNPTGINYQSAYVPKDSPQGSAPSAKPKGPGSSRASLKDTPSMQTATQRLEYKGTSI